MKETQNKKRYYFVDESGDPVFFSRKSKDLIKKGATSPVFIVGHMETEDINAIPCI